jgi:DNA-binding NarL/FixJ family response regulator
MNVIIVDDEPLALEVIETYLENFPELTLKGK